MKNVILALSMLLIVNLSAQIVTSHLPNGKQITLPLPENGKQLSFTVYPIVAHSPYEDASDTVYIVGDAVITSGDSVASKWKYMLKRSYSLEVTDSLYLIKVSVVHKYMSGTDVPYTMVTLQTVHNRHAWHRGMTEYVYAHKKHFKTSLLLY